MYIEKIHIDTFGKLSDFDIDLSSGVNIIEGDNESGKSTVAAFIKFILYGLNQSERERVLSWRTGGAAGSLTLCAEGRRFRIERAMAGSREAVQLIDGETNMPIRHVLDGTTPGEYFLGVDSEMFSATAFVSQIGGMTPSGGKVAEGVENILFSADESVNTKRAVTKLDTARAALLHKNGKGGRIFELDTECARLEEELSEALRIHDEIVEKEAQLSDSKAKYERASAKASDAAASVEQYEIRLMLQLYARKRELEERNAILRAHIESEGSQNVAELRAMEKVNARVTNLRHELEESALREVADSVDESDDPRLDDYIERGGREALDYEEKQYLSKAKVYTVSGITAAILGVAAAVFGLLPVFGGGKPGVIPLIGAAVLELFGVSMFIFAALSRRKAKAILGNYDFDELDRAMEARESARDAAKYAELALTEARRRYDDLCDEIRRTYGCEEHQLEEKIGELTEKLRNFDGVKAEYDKNESLLVQIKAQLSHYSEEELAEKLDAGVDTSNVDVSMLPALRREAEFSTKMAESLEKYIAELEKSLAGLYPMSQDPAALTDRVNALKAERLELRKKHDAYVLAFEKLSEASENLRRSVAPKLAKDAAELISCVTGGRYNSIGVDSELNICVDTDCGNRSLEFFSAGTQDAAYLSLRLALVSMLYRKEKPTVVFDEAFVRQDASRLEQTLGIVSRNGMQSIIFTSNGREAQTMNKIGEFKHILI